MKSINLRLSALNASEPIHCQALYTFNQWAGQTSVRARTLPLALLPSVIFPTPRARFPSSLLHLLPSVPTSHPSPVTAQSMSPKTDTANRLGQLRPCSCCAPSHCSRTTGSSSSLSFSSPVSSGRFSSTYVPMSLSNADWQFRSKCCHNINREYRPSARRTIPFTKAVSSNRSSRFGLTWCTCTVSVARSSTRSDVT